MICPKRNLRQSLRVRVHDLSASQSDHPTHGLPRSEAGVHHISPHETARRNLATAHSPADGTTNDQLKAKGARTRWLTPEEFEALCDQAPPHLKVILTFMIGTGCRTSEALSADVRYWHASTGEIWLPETKNGHARMVQMPQRARDLILSHRVPRSGPLLRNHKGLAYVARDNSGGHIKKVFCTARENARLGADVTPHVLRHTWATWFYASTRAYWILAAGAPAARQSDTANLRPQIWATNSRPMGGTLRVWAISSLSELRNIET